MAEGGAAIKNKQVPGLPLTGATGRLAIKNKQVPVLPLNGVRGTVPITSKQVTLLPVTGGMGRIAIMWGINRDKQLTFVYAERVILGCFPSDFRYKMVLFYG